MCEKRKTYPSDATEAEWQLSVPYLPQPCLTGRPIKWAWPDLIDAIFYVLHEGCKWRALPGDFPKWQSVYRYFHWLRDSHFWQHLNDLLSARVRQKEGREVEPSAGSIDRQSVKARESGSFHGYDAGKKIKGIKRHLLVDTLVHQAAAAPGFNVQIVKRSDDARGFGVLPKRWVVERTISWLMKNRRLARDYERVAESGECYIYMSMCRLLLKRLAA